MCVSIGAAVVIRTVVPMSESVCAHTNTPTPQNSCMVEGPNYDARRIPHTKNSCDDCLVYRDKKNTGMEFLAGEVLLSHVYDLGPGVLLD